MGIDIDTYRQRVGSFRGGHGCNILYSSRTCYMNCGDVACGVLYVGAVWLITALIVLTGLELNPWIPDCMETDTCIMRPFISSEYTSTILSTLGLTFTSIIRMIGAVSFVKRLLIMAGVEQNPGPVDEFNFRYQFLLVELGTELLRKTFDAQLPIGTSLSQHLMSHIKTIKVLVSKGVLTGTQEALLPPKCVNPVLSSFDITLLTCLLRNICGLKKSGNTVWTTPAQNDTSLEAAIARLRICRNKLGHSGTVLIPSTQLDTDWKELCQIMLSLNSKLRNGVANLQSKIDEAETMEIDENLKKQNEETLRIWKESDEVWEHGQAEILETLKRIDQNQTDRSEQIEEKLGKLGEDLGKKVDEGLGKLDEGLRKKLDESFGKLDEGLGKVDEGLGRKLDKGLGKLDKGLGKLDEGLGKKLDDGFGILDQGLGKVDEGLGKKLDKGLGKLDEGLGKLDKGLGKKVDEGLGKLDKGLGKKLDEGFGKLDEGLGKLDEGLGKKLDKGLGKLDEGLGKLDEGLGKKVDEGLGKLDKGLGKLDEGLGKKLEEGLRSVQQHVQAVEERKDQVVPKSPNGNKQNIQQTLKIYYQQNYGTMTVSPLYEFEKEQMLQLYKLPSMFIVDNHDPQSAQKETEVKACKDIFCTNDHLHRDIYITGDAGVGKSSFCQFLCLLWSKAGNFVVNSDMQEYLDFIGKFDFVFYVILRDTERIDVITMIVDQLFFTDNQNERDKLYSDIKYMIKQNDCLVILDGLDEWRPKQTDRKDFESPSKPFSKKALYLTTSRPYKTEHLLKHKDLIHQVKITGITDQSSYDYIKELVDYINKKNSDNKDPESFQKDVKKCGLDDLLCIPIIASHLVVVWFEQKLTNMSRAFIYGNIVNILFEIADKRNVNFPPSTPSEVQLPNSLSKLTYFNNHVTLLGKVCLLSFRSLFNQDECEATLVFTRQQLMSEPYYLDDKQLDALFNIGVLSKNKVIRRFGKQEEKLSFLHLSYLEFFSALFVSAFDTNRVFNDIVAKDWISLETVLKFQNFLLFLAGVSPQTVCQLFRKIFPLISKDLSSISRNAIFHYRNLSYIEQLKSLQSMIISCIKESRRSSVENVFIKLEHFYFDENPNVELLKPLLVFNCKCVKSLYSSNGMYLSEFSQIKKLQSLHVGKIVPIHYEQFTQLISDHTSTLHTISIKGDYNDKPLINGLPVRKPHRLLSLLPSMISRKHNVTLQHLTSVKLCDVRMEHKSLHNLVDFISSNVLFENIGLINVHCNTHRDNECGPFTLSLHNQTNIITLNLCYVNIVCHHINIACIKYIGLRPFSERIVRSYTDLFKSIEKAQLEYLSIYGRYMFDYNTIKSLLSTIKTLSCIKRLTLCNMTLQDNVVFHPDVKHVDIYLFRVTMSDQYFHSFTQNVVHIQSMESVTLYQCTISTGNEETYREMSEKESFDFMCEYLTKQEAVNVTYNDIYTDQGFNGYMIEFRPTDCQ